MVYLSIHPSIYLHNLPRKYDTMYKWCIYTVKCAIYINYHKLRASRCICFWKCKNISLVQPIWCFCNLMYLIYCNLSIYIYTYIRECVCVYSSIYLTYARNYACTQPAGIAWFLPSRPVRQHQAAIRNWALASVTPNVSWAIKCPHWTSPNH